ncbi:dienelactone hydrolase family protein [Nocardia huaxiensis]|uniref:Dienelactone hydrolase family protein n=1 Tax=Nocardia huaxiensis TaxID=2755382 RepID=A0A7D6VBN8_9NOCA|nr:dienelactone hydrolase family protein [Nocardia huaxiensis]QLY31231.1 dienelactone hydrolase family protein [Nocardia huaxiensis]UFS94768.1 dienelactone hydrolase family protein [Nocardia huaxiensis]
MSGIYRELAPVHDTTTVPLVVIEPEGHTRGGIVVLHESREFTEPLLDLMRSLAEDGWTVLAPDLFHRANGVAPDKVFGADLYADFDACFDWLTGRGVFGDCIGVLGFDSAGTAAALVATNRRVGAAVSVAAQGIESALTPQALALAVAAPQLKAPWLALFGADDPHTPPEQVDRLRDAAAHADVATLVVTYPGLHHRPDHPGFDPAALDDIHVVDAQTRIFDWFDSHLR